MNINELMTLNNAIMEYKRANGSYKDEYVDVPIEYISNNNYPFGKVINEIKDGFNGNKLSLDEILLASNLGVDLMDKPLSYVDDLVAKLRELEEDGIPNLKYPKYAVFKNGINKYNWLANCRSKKKNDELPLFLDGYLSGLGMEWEIEYEIKNVNWYKYFKAACIFKRNNGHLYIPYGYVTPTGLKLGEWWHEQIRRYKWKYMENDIHRSLSDKQIEKLESLGICWEILTPDEVERKEWEYFIDLLETCLKKVKRPFIINKDYRYKNYPLGKKVYEVIEKYNNGTLPQSRINSLKAIGFKFSTMIK